MTEEEWFMVEAAEQVGFEVADDECSEGENITFRCTASQIVDLVRRAREQGRKDILEVRP